MIPCDTPWCDFLVAEPPLDGQGSRRGVHNFCKVCTDQHSSRVLIAQVEHGKDIRSIILDASIFKTAGGMGGYMGVSFVTTYNWIRRYFGLSFQEFRRKYICGTAKSSRCYLLDIGRVSYTRNDHVIKKIRSRRYCACVIAMERNLIMTDTPLQVLQGILKGSPKIVKVSDDRFALVPDPLYFLDRFPVYTDLHADQTNKSSGRRASHPLPGFKFWQRVLIALDDSGGSLSVDALMHKLTSSDGSVPRRNNTRREVYKHPQYLKFSESDDQVMQLREGGVSEVSNIRQVRAGLTPISS